MYSSHMIKCTDGKSQKIKIVQAGVLEPAGLHTIVPWLYYLTPQYSHHPLLLCEFAQVLLVSFCNTYVLYKRQTKPTEVHPHHPQHQQ